MEDSVSIQRYLLARALKAQAHMDLLDSLGVDNWGDYEGLAEEDEDQIDKDVAEMPSVNWQPVTATEPADEDCNVLLACDGSVIGILTARWTDGAGEENWKVDDNLWDADDAPTHYMRLPAPPTEK